jgi:aspartate ammonia-lyase
VFHLNETNRFRIEKDFLGEKEIPANAYYGIQTLRAKENFPITGYPLHEEVIKALGVVKKAAALANMDVGYLNPRLGKAIVKAAEEVAEEKWNEQFVIDPIQGGAGTSINMNANEVIANRALELLGLEKGHYFELSPNVHVNMAQSTNDVFPTSARIAIVSLLNQLIKTMETLVQGFKAKSAEFDSIIKMGRTHLQDAVPIRLGQEFEAYYCMLSRDLRRIKQTREDLYQVNMGATAIGTGLNADPLYSKKVVQYLVEFTGYPFIPAHNLIDATQNTDAYTQVSAALKVCAINMSKIANDLRLLSSGPRAGIGEITLPALQPGSSIMPGKVNPVMCELVNQVSFQVIGNDQTICLASEAGQLELNVMEPVLFFNLIQSISIMNHTFTVFYEKCVKGIKANKEVCENYVENSVGIVTAINPHIGYETAAQIASEAIKTGKPVRQLCLERNILSEDELRLILNPKEMTNPGIAGASLLQKN